MLRLLWSHEALGEQPAEFLSKTFDFTLIGQLFIAPLLGKVVMVEKFYFLLDESDTWIDEQRLRHGHKRER